MDRHLLDILRCPITGQNLQPLPREKLGKLNAAIGDGALRYRDGETVERALDAALITANGTTVYAIRDDIPVMLEDKAIPVEQLRDL